ncbi:MAG: hypothetical protein H0W78_14510 [Planctomycetes bacterium]|nr:hypothetical protein [Planctomycetota bacterium]
MIRHFAHWKDPLLVMRGSGARIIGMLVQLVVIARICGTEQLGIYSFALALTTPIILVCGWHLRQFMAMDANGWFAWKAYRDLRNISFVGGALVLGLLCWLWPTAQVHMVLVGLVYLAKAAEAYPELGHGLLQRRKDFAAVGNSNAIRSLCGTLGLCVPLLLQAALETAVMLQVVMLVAVCVLVDRRQVAPLIAGWSGRSHNGLALLRRVWALGIAAGTGGLVAGIPRLVLVSYGREAEAGILLILLNLFAPASLLIAAFAQSNGSRLADAGVAQTKAEWSARLRRCIVVGYLGTLVNGFAAWVVILSLPWILGQPFDVSIWLVMAFAVAGAMQSHVSFVGTGLDSLGSHVVKLPNLLLQGGVLAVMCHLWIVPHGLWGVVGALALSSLVVLSTMSFSLSQRMRSHFGVPS